MWAKVPFTFPAMWYVRYDAFELHNQYGESSHTLHQQMIEYESSHIVKKHLYGIMSAAGYICAKYARRTFIARIRRVVASRTLLALEQFRTFFSSYTYILVHIYASAMYDKYS